MSNDHEMNRLHAIEISDAADLNVTRAVQDIACIVRHRLASLESRAAPAGDGRDATLDQRDAEWQRRLMPLHESCTGDGCESGDPIDWSIAALRIARMRVLDRLDETRAERDTLRAGLDAAHHTIGQMKEELRMALSPRVLLTERAQNAERALAPVTAERDRLAAQVRALEADVERGEAVHAENERTLEYRRDERARVMAILGKPGVAGTDALEQAARGAMASLIQSREQVRELTDDLAKVPALVAAARAEGLRAGAEIVFGEVRGSRGLTDAGNRDIRVALVDARDKLNIAIGDVALPASAVSDETLAERFIAGVRGGLPILKVTEVLAGIRAVRALLAQPAPVAGGPVVAWALVESRNRDWVLASDTRAHMEHRAGEYRRSNFVVEVRPLGFADVATPCAPPVQPAVAGAVGSARVVGARVALAVDRVPVVSGSSGVGTVTHVYAGPLYRVHWDGAATGIYSPSELRDPSTSEAHCHEPPVGDQDACDWSGPMAALRRDPDGVTHCPRCGSTAIEEPDPAPPVSRLVPLADADRDPSSRGPVVP